MKYDVTIGIPVYKAVDYIEKTMESALCQTFANIEYLIVDDCGNDGTIEVVERFRREHQRGKNIHIIHNDQNLGVGKSRNLIIEHAQGEFVRDNNYPDACGSTISGRCSVCFIRENKYNA